ncbi:unnamed protein product [Choristocarpus tenellus]
MWGPQLVVNEHKRRATVVWGILLLGWLCFALWTILEAVEQRNNPPTKTSVVEGAYKFPDIQFCFYKEFGCETNPRYCAGNATVAVYHLSSNFEEYHYYTKWPSITAYENERYWNCRTVELSSLTPNATILDNEDFPSLYVDMEIAWPLADGDASSLESYSNAMAFYTTDGQAGHSLGNLQYDRIEPFSNVTSFTLTDITLKKSSYKRLGRATSSIFDANTLNTYSYYEAESTSSDFHQVVSGLMRVRISVLDLSFLSIEEVDPLELSTVLGSIGGFWQYVLLVWGVFFVLKIPPMRTARHLGKCERSVSKLDATAAKEEKEMPPSGVD